MTIPPSPPHRVCILMATHNGAAFLPDQLSSIAAQQAVEWRLIVSDDGSTDKTPALLKQFADAQNRGRVTLLDGPNQGATANFRHLLRQAPQGCALAFADQDDIWLPEKLQHACSMLAAAETPALYGGRVMVADQLGRPLRPGPMPARPPSLRNALVQNVFSGNTIVINPAAAALLQRVEARLQAAGVGYPLHDWWAYILVAGAGGGLTFNPHPHVLYRQHDGNVIGENSGPMASLARLQRVLSGQNAAWLGQNLDALLLAEDLLTPDALRLIETVKALRAAPSAIRRLAELRRSGLYAQSRHAQLGLWLAVLLGRI